MSDDLLLSLAKIVGSVALLAAVLWAIARVARSAKLDPELSRKAVHISLGLYCLSFPWVFNEAWEVSVTCALAVLIFLLARTLMRKQLGEGLHGVERKSYGEVLFAISVALLFWMKDGDWISEGKSHAFDGPALYVLAILILTLCDAASAVVGAAYGRRTFRVEEGIKSVEGVVIFFLTAWLLSLVTFLLLTDLGRSEVILLAFITAAFGALLEAASWRGLDNLFIPLGLYFLLANLIHFGVDGLAFIAALFFIALIALMWVSRHSGADRHFLAIAATLFFCIAIVSGPLSVLAPATALTAYLVMRRWKPLADAAAARNEALTLLLVIFAGSMIMFCVSNLARLDTIYAYNLAFTALAAAIVGRLGAPAWAVGLACTAAWLAQSVRVLWTPGLSAETLRFSIIGGVGILVMAIIGISLSHVTLKRPWATLGGLSVLIGLASIPLSPGLSYG